MPDLTSAEKKIERCGAKMLLAHKWWASLYLRLRRREAKWVPTMATDGTWLLYNEAFTERIDDTECLFVLMHETAHCALLHCFRRGSREPFRWNIAADAAANALLKADGVVIPRPAFRQRISAFWPRRFYRVTRRRQAWRLQQRRLRSWCLRHARRWTGRYPEFVRGVLARCACGVARFTTRPLPRGRHSDSSLADRSNSCSH